MVRHTDDHDDDEEMQTRDEFCLITINYITMCSDSILCMHWLTNAYLCNITQHIYESSLFTLISFLLLAGKYGRMCVK